MMKRILMVVMILMGLFVFAEPTVTDVVAKQRYPWNGLVDMTCKVSGINETAYVFQFAVSVVMPDSDKVNEVSNYWVIQNGTNSFGQEVYTNGNYHLLWDARADLGQVNYDNVVVRITIVQGGRAKVQLWAGGPYWAKTNIGADEPEDFGYYFWWGDTIGYKRVNGEWVATDGSSSHFSGSSTIPTYNKSIDTLKSMGWITASGVLVPRHDAAHVHWGGKWRMPTKQELEDLNSNCDWTWTTMNGVKGYVVRGRGDYVSANIFLPAAGYSEGGYLLDFDEGGYWSSLARSNTYDDAWGLFFGACGHGTSSGGRRAVQPVRPVQGFID